MTKEWKRVNSIREKGPYTKYDIIIEEIAIAKSVKREYKPREERGGARREDRIRLK